MKFFRLLLVATAISSMLPSLASARDKVVATFSTAGFAFLPPLVAKAMDLYAVEDIDAELIITGGDTKALAALVGGGADVSFLSVPTVIRARENGIDVMMVGYCVAQYPTNLVASKDWAAKHGITSESSTEQKIAALRGSNFGITAPGSGTDLLMRFLANKAGLNPDRDMTLTTLGGSDSIAAAFVQGRIDGFPLSAPVAENAVKNHNAMMLFNFAKGEIKELDGFAYTSIAFRQKFLDGKKDLAVRFLRTQQRALMVINAPDTTQQARDAVWKMYWPNVNKSLFDDIWANWKNAWPPSIAIPDSSLSQVVNFTNLVEARKIEFASAKAAFTNVYADEVIASMRIADQKKDKER